MYTIKAIPTRYRDVDFRSRLEATWAAYFDLAKVPWEYEPFDMDGWAPDFLLRVGAFEILAEVKPVADPAIARADYAKAMRFAGEHWVACLGRAPMAFSVGLLLDRPNDESRDADVWLDVHEKLCPSDAARLWRMATNVTRWKAPRA